VHALLLTRLEGALHVMLDLLEHGHDREFRRAER
jgi:hypothetical protein